MRHRRIAASNLAALARAESEIYQIYGARLVRQAVSKFIQNSQI